MMPEHINNLVYEELKRMAASVRYSFPRLTLSPSTIVSEAWLRLAREGKLGPEFENEFYFRAGRAMRQLLYDAARRKGRVKRGGALIRVPFDDKLAVPCEVEFIALHEALEALEAKNPKLVSIVDLSFFVGLSEAEIGQRLDLAERTIRRRLRAAMALLGAEIRQAS